MSGHVYIASMNLRGKWGKLPDDAPILTRVNVTSAQGTRNADRLAFSPMNSVPGLYKGFHCFENYWQSGKVWEGISHDQSRAWWLAQTEPKRRYPLGKSKRVLYARFPGVDGDLDYVESRKQVYVPEYFAYMMSRSDRAKELRERVLKGENMVVFDFDGPRDEDGEPMCVELTPQLLLEKLHDTRHPFGHGYIVAAYLRGFEDVLV